MADGTALSTLTLLHGSEAPLAAPVALRAGPVQAVLHGIDLRYVRLGDVELVRRIYVAVRDRNWNTIPGVASEVEVQAGEDRFAVAFTVRHCSHDTGFVWHGSIVGDPSGRIRFAMDGRGERDMLYNRIGFCVLHPWRESAGRAYRALTPGGVVEGTLPDLVAPQRFAGGVYVPLFPSASGLELADVVLDFEGDLFETEDQRNWTDASLKTYCTPLARGFPHRLSTGEERAQAVTVTPRVAGAAGAAGSGAAPSGAARRTLTVGEATGGPVCDVGLSLPGPPSDAEAALLGVIGPAHVRHEVHMGSADWRAGLESAVAAAARLGARLELAVFVGEGADLGALGAALRDAPVARVLAAAAGAQTTSPVETTPPELVRAVRDGLALGPDVPVAGGTDMYFCELNRTRPQAAEMDGVFWSMNPQVHAFDDLSVMETPEAQGEQVRTAMSFSDGRPLFVGPVTLRRRYNVNATVADVAAEAELPDSVDPRQASLLAAAWTLASVKHLAEQGAAAATYFETVGWRGVIQGDADPPLPALFPGRAGEAFPLFHVLADACALRGAAVLRCPSAAPLELAALAARRGDGRLTVLVANLTPRPLTAGVAGAGGEGRVRRLSEATAPLAMRDPVAFRAEHRTEPLGELELSPYETLRIDIG